MPLLQPRSPLVPSVRVPPARGSRRPVPRSQHQTSPLPGVCCRIGSSSGQTRIASGQRGWNRQPLGGCDEVGWRAGDVVSSRRLQRDGRVQQLAGVRMLGWVSTVRAGPCSARLPGVHHRDRGRRPRPPGPRLWVISSSDVSKFACMSRRMPRICASTMTSRAVVGSSAIDQPSGGAPAPGRS